MAILLASLSSSIIGGNRAHAEISATDCLAASNASIKLDNTHLLRAERKELLTCASAACPSDIRNECIRRFEEVNSSIPTIIFEAKDVGGNDLAAVKVIMDKEVLAPRLEGSAIALDPGVHTFVFEAAGRPTVLKQYVIREGQKNRNELILFEAAGASPAARAAAAARTSSVLRASGPSPSPSPGSSPSPSPKESAEPTRTRTVLAVVAGGIGVVGLGAGALFGLRARSKRDDAQTLCPGVCDDQRGVDAWHDARRTGNIATGAFIVGGLGVASAVLLSLTGEETRDQPQAELQLGSGQVRLTFGGRW